MGKLTMGEKVAVSAPVPEQVVTLREEIVEKPVFRVQEKKEIVVKPQFFVETEHHVVQEPVFQVKPVLETVEKPVFVVVDAPEEITKRHLIEKVSLSIQNTDWALRILLGISAAVHLWSTFK